MIWYGTQIFEKKAFSRRDWFGNGIVLSGFKKKLFNIQHWSILLQLIQDSNTRYSCTYVLSYGEFVNDKGDSRSIFGYVMLRLVECGYKRPPPILLRLLCFSFWCASSSRSSWLFFLSRQYSWQFTYLLILPHAQTLQSSVYFLKKWLSEVFIFGIYVSFICESFFSSY